MDSTYRDSHEIGWRLSVSRPYSEDVLEDPTVDGDRLSGHVSIGRVEDRELAHVLGSLIVSKGDHSINCLLVGFI